MKSMIWDKFNSILIVLALLSTGTFKTAAQVSVKGQITKDELKREIADLRQTALLKVDADADTTANGFASSENRLRELRWIYSLQTALDLVSGTFSVISSGFELLDPLDGASLEKKFGNALKLKNSVEFASLALTIQSMREDGEKLAIVFDRSRYVESVKTMLKKASETQQPFPIRFEREYFTQSIKTSIYGFGGENFVVAPHQKVRAPCISVAPRGDAQQQLTAFKGVKEVNRYIGNETRQLELDIAARNYTPQQISELIALVKKLKTSLLQSKLDAVTIELQIPRSLASSNCQPSKTNIWLGRIAAQQNILSAALDKSNENLEFEKIDTIKTAADGISSATQVFLKRKGETGAKTKILDYASKASLLLDVADFSKKQVFSSIPPEQMLAETPQTMLLEMPTEASQTVLLIDTLASFIRQAKSPPIISVSPPPIANAPEIPTLFLFDVSSSMLENDKIGQARNSSLIALREIQENKRLGRGDTPISIWAFSGDCSPNTARQILPFTANLTQTENILRTKIPRPDGGTPLPQAIEKASAQINNYLISHSQSDEGRIILLSDGQSTCGEIRPSGIYSQARIITVKKIRFLTIGFNIEPGSAAERDLQYLASASGGQYFPAQNQQQLSRAFEKTIRVYTPKSSANASTEFQNITNAITRRDFQKARQFAADYLKNNPSDAFGFYNLAISLEALSRYKGAAENYRKYLQLAPEAADRQEIEARIAKLEQDYQDQFFYFQKLLQSDLDYLKAYYARLFNRENERNAAEFAGFVAEKQEFYANLADILEIRSSRIERDAKDLSDSLGVLNRRVELPSFDRDAVSLLTISIGQLEDVIERIGNSPSPNL